MLSAIEILHYEDRLDALDLYSDKATARAEEKADELCDMFGLEGDERKSCWDKAYNEEYERLMEEYEKAL